MNPATLKKLDLILDRLERRAKRPRRRFPMAAIVLGLGLALGDILLTRFVPTLWAEFLPWGLQQAATLRGWPGLIWQSALLCHHHQTSVQAAIAVVSLTCLVLGSRIGPMRFLVWLAALGVILLDGAILFGTIHTCLRATAAAAGIPLG
jgi:hypothetical protein